MSEIQVIAIRAIGLTNVPHALPFATENITFRKSTISGIRPAQFIFECERMMEIIMSCATTRDGIVGLWTAIGKHRSLDKLRGPRVTRKMRLLQEL
jgi:hypothetical protein